MAYWKRYNNGRLRIWDKFKKSVPRKLYRHLDTAPEHAIISWVATYEKQYEGKAWTPDRIPPSEWVTVLDAYCNYLLVRQGRDRITVQQYKGYIKNYTFEYFLQQNPPARDLTDWPGTSINLVDYMEKAGVTPSVINRTLICTRRFWQWLVMHRHVHADLPLLPYTLKEQDTPLKALKTPSEVLEFVKGVEDKEVKVMAILGYFCSLRPQETFSAKTLKYAAGPAAEKLECSRIMKEAGLFGRLAIFLSSQVDKFGNVKQLKTKASGGWVSCFDKEAAELLAEVLRDGGNLFTKPNKYYYKLWKEIGLPGVSLKDLRRASLYHLGHNTRLADNPLNVQKHARHKNLTTTQKYMRRPDEQVMTTNLADLHLVL